MTVILSAEVTFPGDQATIYSGYSFKGNFGAVSDGRSDLTIGRLAKATACDVQTIRYYERIGLLPRPPRTQGNQRLYAPRDADRLSFIRHARGLGFGLDAIRDLLRLADDPTASCAEADAIARARLVEVDRALARLTALKNALEGMTGACANGTVADCRIIEALSDHGHREPGDHLPPDQ